MRAVAGWISPARADWRQHHESVTFPSTTAIAPPDQQSRRPHMSRTVSMLASVSDVRSSTRSSNTATTASGDRAIAGRHPAVGSSLLADSELDVVAKFSDEESGSSAGGSGRGSAAGVASTGSGGRRAGAFQRLPMVQLAKEQLSSAQRAARRTPYSRKLKNEAQRERNRRACCCTGLAGGHVVSRVHWRTIRPDHCRGHMVTAG